MSADSLPKELVFKCLGLIERTHKSIGLSNLPARVWEKRNMVALACLPDALAIMGSARGAFKRRALCWLSGVAVLIAAWFLSWWVLLGLVVVFVAHRKLVASEHKMWMLLAAMLLSLEVLAQDFAGWGRAYPKEREKALSLLEDEPSKCRTMWLDYYLPRRKEISPSLLQGFGPH